MVLSWLLALFPTLAAANLLLSWTATWDPEYYSIPAASLLGLLLLTVFLLSFALFFFLLTRREIRFLQKVVNILSVMAAGNLGERIPASRKDELGQVAIHINSMAEELEKQRHKERQNERNRMELITGVSHDLRTPLTSMIGYIHLLKDRGYRSDEEYNRYVEHTYTQALRLQKRIDDLFEYTRLTSPEAAVQLQRIFIGELLQQLLFEFQPLAKEYGLTIRYIPPGEEIEMEVDPEKIVRALDNLLMNALKFSRRPGEIDVNCAVEEDWLRIDVENEGVPLTSEEEERLFERFYRVDSSRTSGEPGLGTGSGLGLAISKSIAQMHGGKLTLNHTQGQYQFRLELPRTPEMPLQPFNKKTE